MAKNSSCAISDSVLCKWIGKDCNECHINGIKHDDDIKKALSNFEAMLSLLPEDIDELQGDECQFCKSDPGKRSRFAMIDLGNSEPKSETGMFFGFGKKVRRRIGSLMPMSISICQDCKRAFLFVDIVKWLVMLVVIAATFTVVALTSVGGALRQELSLLIITVAAVAGYFAGKAVSSAYVKAKSSRVRFNIFEIPICRKMQNLGWFTVQDDPGVTKFIFSKKSHTNKLKDIMDEQAGKAPV